MTKQDAPTTTDAERAEFEAHWRKRHAPVPMNTRMHDDGRYACNLIESEWAAYREGIAYEAARASSAAAQPEWKLVPIEPTPEILAAAKATADKHLFGDWCNTECSSDKERADKSNRDYWRAMVEAAPPAKTADTGEAP
jgi:hypothetical protein